jgi:hypothetical protein
MLPRSSNQEYLHPVDAAFRDEKEQVLVSEQAK